MNQLKLLPKLMERDVPSTALTHLAAARVQTCLPVARWQIRIGQTLDWLRTLNPWSGGEIVIREGVHYQWLTHRISGVKKLHRVRGQMEDAPIMVSVEQSTKLPAWMRNTAGQATAKPLPAPDGSISE